MSRPRALVPPLEGALVVTSPFGPRLHPVTQLTHHHAGVDYRATIGTPVRAAERGRVVRIDREGKDQGRINGNAVFLRLELELANGEFIDAELVAYLHLSDVLVGLHDPVVPGQVVGRTGASGRVTVPHLHVHLYPYGSPVAVDPHPYFTLGAPHH